MFEIDKKAFGGFITELRKEKGMTQKEVAEKLFVSDKAVSKWETGGSMPDITLLTPMAKLLDVTVPELLECRRYTETEQIDPKKAEDMMNHVIQMTEEERKISSAERKKLQKWYIGATVWCLGAGLFVYQYFSMIRESNPMEQPMPLMFAIFGLVFGAYACFIAREKLPTYFDENKISAYSDGFFRMNLPGVTFNNSNWRHILKTIRVWSIAMLILGPVVWFAACYAALYLDRMFVYGISSGVTAAMMIVSLFVPIYIMAKKYE